MCKQRVASQSIEIESVPVIIQEEPEFNKSSIKSKRIKKEDSLLVPLKDCVLGMKGVKIQGKIFNIESQWIKNNTTLRQTVFLHDEEDALSFSQFLDNKDEIEKFGLLKKGDCLEIFGDIVYDNPNKDIQIQVRDIRIIQDWMKSF